MTKPEPLTRSLGKAERSLQALLQSRLKSSGIDFPDWVALTHLRQGPLGRSDLQGAMLAGRAIGADDFDRLIDGLIARGLVETVAAGLAMSDLGRALYDPLKTEIDRIVAALQEGIPDQDLAATRRTLAIITERASKTLAKAEA